MTVFFSDGFESGDFSAWTGTSGSPTVVASPVHSGSYAMNATVNGYYVYKTFTAGTTFYARVYVNFSQLPTNSSVAFTAFGFLSGGLTASNVIGLVRLDYFAASPNYFWDIRCLSGGALTDFAGSLFTPSTNRWYCLELFAKVDATQGAYSLWVDGVSVVSASNLVNNGRGSIDRVVVGNDFSSGNFGAYFDDVVVSDSYIGPTVLSVLVSDSLSLSDCALRHKPVLIIAENVAALDLTRVDKFLPALDSIYLIDSAFISKLLVINDSVSLVETVEQGVWGVRTRLFLSLGDLAIQLTGN